ncbi:Riboflavin transporter MCH5 [Termitomyces sp. J132]|nr:hypothetical protein H2248_009106 [Termitomyces sp. 'cryptogamus']KNZ74379.1 Riboflavin transporter MCH5 [Termitomyces sp. J132]
MSATLDSSLQPQQKEKPTDIAALVPSQPPDGGLGAWCTVLGAFLIQVCNFGYTSSFGVYQDFYVREYITNASPSSISWIGSFNAFLLISGGVFAGRLYDRGFFYPLLWGGSILTVFSIYMLSLARPDHYYQVFLAQSLGAGLGGGLTYVPSVAIVSQYFTTKQALAMTIVASGASIGAIIHPIMLNNLFGRLGFGNTVRASASVEAVLLLIACCLMKTRVSTKKAALQDSKNIINSLSTDGAYIVAAFGLLIFSIGFYFPQFYIQLDATSHKLDKNLAFYSLIILNFASFFGRILPGFFANTLGVMNMMIFATGACAAVIFGMIGLKDIPGVVLIALFYGFFAGTFVGLTSPMLVVLSRDIMSQLGIRMGIAFFFSGIGGLIGTPISGALLTEEFNWWRPAVFCGVTSMVGSACFATALIILKCRKRLAEDKGQNEA